MRKLLLIFICLLPCSLSASSFNEAFDMSARGFAREANRVTFFGNENTGLDRIQQEKELDYLSGSLLELKADHLTNPVYWFVMGLHSRNLASYFQQSGQGQLVAKNIQDKNDFYQSAMELDKNNKPHLSAKAYAVMKPGLPDRLKQYAIETELGLGGSGENDSYYWYLHWSNIDELSQQNRFDEAQIALDRMKQELTDKGLENSAFTSLLNKAEKEFNDHKLLSQSEKQPVRKKQKVAEDSVIIGEYIYYLIWFVVVLFIVVIAFVFFVLDKKRRLK